jgi:hypothetical protein
MNRLILALGAAMVGFCAPASAAVVCNEDGDCWRVKEQYEYKPEFKVRIYDDNWKWKDTEKDKYRWREAGPKRGYYSRGVWIDF